MKRGKVSICIVGNCQAERLQRLVKIKRPDIDVFEAPGVYRIGAEERLAFEGAVAEADIVFSQQIGPKYHFEYCTNDYVNRIAKAPIVFIPNVWFLGYEPSLVRALLPRGDVLVGPMEDIHLLPLIEGYYKGLSCAEAFNAWQEPSADVLDRGPTSLRMLHEREASYDIRIAPIIEAEFRDRRLMATMNHPLPVLLDRMADQLLAYLELPSTERVDLASLDDYLRLTRPFPATNPAAHREYGLAFERDTVTRGFALEDGMPIGSDAYYSPPDLAEAFFRFYDRRGIRELELSLQSKYFNEGQVVLSPSKK